MERKYSKLNSLLNMIVLRNYRQGSYRDLVLCAMDPDSKKSPTFSSPSYSSRTMTQRTVTAGTVTRVREFEQHNNSSEVLRLSDLCLFQSYHTYVAMLDVTTAVMKIKPAEYHMRLD